MLYQMNIPGNLDGKMTVNKLIYTIGIVELIQKEKITQTEIVKLLKHHVNGDFGNIDSEDKQIMEENYKAGEGQLLGNYKIKDYKIWIITEWDRSRTTVLLPEEY